MNFSLFPMYFLGANSCEGFVSHFKESYDCKRGDTAYIIKGGPGTGKSSLMKYIAAATASSVKRIELFPCSSDPDSLDGIRICGSNTVILDGTAPHVVEPEHPGICENIINTGEFWNSKLLRENRAEILDISQKNKAFHTSAARYITAAGRLLSDNLNLQQKHLKKEKIDAFCKAITRKYLPRKNKKSTITRRFLSGITPKGIVFFESTLHKDADNLIIINDKYGAAANEIMQNLKVSALSLGYDIIVIESAFLPSRVIDHIIIPELKLAFCTENDYMHIKSDARRIHSRRFEDNDFKNHRAKLRFNSKVARELLTSACESLFFAKATHDKLEKYYIDAMDFDALDEYIVNLTDKIKKAT